MCNLLCKLESRRLEEDGTGSPHKLQIRGRTGDGNRRKREYVALDGLKEEKSFHSEDKSIYTENTL